MRLQEEDWKIFREGYFNDTTHNQHNPFDTAVLFDISADGTILKFQFVRRLSFILSVRRFVDGYEKDKRNKIPLPFGVCSAVVVFPSI